MAFRKKYASTLKIDFAVLKKNADRHFDEDP